MEQLTNHSKKGSIALWVVFAVVVIAAAGIAYYMLRDSSSLLNTNTVPNANTVANGNQNSNASINTNTTTNINSSTNTNASVDTSDWKKYNNSKYGYSFMYPSDWQVLDSPDNTTPGPEAPGVGFGISDIEFRVDVKDSSTYDCSSLANCINKYPYRQDSSDIVSNPETVMIGGQEASYYKIERPQSGNWLHHVWYLYPQENYIVIYTVSKLTGNLTTKPVYDEIISTFVFE